jgi:hypothetical protein
MQPKCGQMRKTLTLAVRVQRLDLRRVWRARRDSNPNLLIRRLENGVRPGRRKSVPAGQRPPGVQHGCLSPVPSPQFVRRPALPARRRTGSGPWRPALAAPDRRHQAVRRRDRTADRPQPGQRGGGEEPGAVVVPAGGCLMLSPAQGPTQGQGEPGAGDEPGGVLRGPDKKEVTRCNQQPATTTSR